MKRELARRGESPRDLIIGLTGSQKSLNEYQQDEIIRLNAEIEERDRRLAQTKPLEIFQDKLSLDCPLELSRKTKILECADHRKHQRCIQKNCPARATLLYSLHYFIARPS